MSWTPFQPRTSALAAALGGRACYITGSWPGRSTALVPLRYLAHAAQMWRLLNRLRPRILIVVTAPVFAPLVGWLWCATHGVRLVVDCHTGAFHSRRWRWARPIHRALLRRTQAALVHSEEDEAMVRAWGAPVLLLPDDLPDFGPPVAASSAGNHRIVIAGRLEADEPVAAVLAAAALTPGIEVRFTGDPSRLPSGLRSRAPANATFLGYLPYAEFLAELKAADAVGVFTTDPHVMSRAAFEAIAVGRPLILSDHPGLRARFGAAALFCRNQPDEMARVFRRAVSDRRGLTERSQRLQGVLRAHRERALSVLRLRMTEAGLKSRAAVTTGLIEP